MVKVTEGQERCVIPVVQSFLTALSFLLIPVWESVFLLWWHPYILLAIITVNGTSFSTQVLLNLSFIWNMQEEPFVFVYY